MCPPRPAASSSIGDNTFTYTPALNFNTTRPPIGQVIQGPFTFTYRASAAGRVSAPATVTINVTEVNDNPTRRQRPVRGRQAERSGRRGPDCAGAGQRRRSARPRRERNADGHRCRHGGSAVRCGWRADKSFTRRRGTIGTDSFTYTVSDGRGGTATATVNVTCDRLRPEGHQRLRLSRQ